MSAPIFAEGEITPGTLFYMRHWSVENAKVQVGTYVTAEGQLWWIPSPTQTRGIASRSMCVCVKGRPVAVRGRPELRNDKPGRLLVEVVDSAPESSDGAASAARPPKRVTIRYNELIAKIAEGVESVDAEFENA